MSLISSVVRCLAAVIGFVLISGLGVAHAENRQSITINGVSVVVEGANSQSISSNNEAIEITVDNFSIKATQSQVILNGEPRPVNGYAVLEIDATGWGIIITADANNVFNVTEVQALQTEADNGNKHAQNVLGVKYLLGEGVPQNVEKAVQLYKASALQGVIESQRNLANLLWQGKRLERDPDEAILWARMAANQGDAEMIALIGLAHRRGEGAPKDPQKALEWLAKAADAGSNNAMMDIGYMHDVGEGIPVDLAKAVEWYTKSLDAGNAAAANNLGLMYMDGRGVQKDFDRAEQLLRQAEAGGNDKAAGNLQRLAELRQEAGQGGGNSDLPRPGGNTADNSDLPQPGGQGSADNSDLPQPGGQRGGDNSDLPRPGGDQGQDDGPPPLPPSNDAAGQIFALLDGKKEGPFTAEQIKEMAAAGRITSDSLVFVEGTSGWAKAADVPEIAELLTVAVAPPPPVIQDLYVIVNGQQQGPLDGAALQALIKSGQVTADTQAWKPGMQDWGRAGDVPEISALLGGAGQGGGNTPLPPPVKESKVFKVRSYCSATGKEGIAEGQTLQIATDNAIKACVAAGGLPNCCPNNITELN
ncbi:MAG: GYF domain-containing protein [Pseudomonadota bacterium]